MVDLAIAANFVRELTEEQFAEQRRIGRRGPAEQRPHASRSAATTRSVNGSDPVHGSGRSEPTRHSRSREETTGLRRALARLAHVRG
jgi:hypothetical protein